MWTLELAVMLVMIAFNSVFAAYEISLASIGAGRLHSFLAEKKRGAEAAVRMKENIEGSLAVVQLGITLVGVIAAATGGAGAEETFEPMLLRWGVPESISQILGNRNRCLAAYHRHHCWRGAGAKSVCTSQQRTSLLNAFAHHGVVRGKRKASGMVSGKLGHLDHAHRGSS